MTLHAPEAREKVLHALLGHVPFEGWTIEALRRAVQEAGFEEGDEYRVFQGSPQQALEAFFQWTDAKMLRELKARNLSDMKVRDRIETAVKIRLSLLAPYKEAVRKTLSTLAHPSYGPKGLELLGRSMSEIWYAAGDTSTDFNYYTKRALLTGVYVSTLWVWLDDPSPDLRQTQDHLAKRLDQVLQIPKIKGHVRRALSHLCHMGASLNPLKNL